MAHSVILLGVFTCAIDEATGAGETDLVSILGEIRDKGTELQHKRFPPLSEAHEAQEQTINRANDFAQSVCDGNTLNRMAEAQDVLDDINALL